MDSVSFERFMSRNWRLIRPIYIRSGWVKPQLYPVESGKT